MLESSDNFRDMRKYIFKTVSAGLVAIFMLTTGAIAAETDKQAELYERARRYYFDQKFAVADALLSKILEQRPDHGAALSLKGDIALYQKKYDRALQAYRMAAEIAEHPAHEFYRIGQVQIEKGDATAAREAFLKSYAIDSQLKINLFQAGYVYLTLDRDKEKTIEYWQKFVDEAPEDAQRENVIKALALLKNPDFILPAADSNISLEEALLLGGKQVEASKAEVKDSQAGLEEAKTSNETEGLLEDNEL